MCLIDLLYQWVFKQYERLNNYAITFRNKYVWYSGVIILTVWYKVIVKICKFLLFGLKGVKQNVAFFLALICLIFLCFFSYLWVFCWIYLFMSMYACFIFLLKCFILCFGHFFCCFCCLFVLQLTKKKDQNSLISYHGLCVIDCGMMTFIIITIIEQETW